MKAATDQLPTEALLWLEYGAALSARGDHLSVEARNAHKSVMGDPDIMKVYDDSVGANKKGIELSAASKKPNTADQATAWNSIGTAYARTGKIPEAQDAFEQAVKLSPAGAGLYYGNESVVLFNAGNSDAAGVAAQKAIDADPTRPNPYFIKGQTLISKATVDKSGKIVAPPGCVDAYQKYLELEPEGSQAATVKEILTSMGEKINTRYVAPKKK